jgi:hypothetical protein
MVITDHTMAITDHAMAIRKRTKAQTVMHKTLHGKLKIEQHELH